MSRTLSVSLPDQKILPFLTGRPEAEFLVWDMTEPPPRPVIDIVVPPYMGRIDLLRALDGVTTSLVQSQSIGFDGVAEVLPPGSIFANAAGVHETSTAELVLALLLASQRSLPEYVRQQDRGEWKQLTSPSLADRRVLIVGYGGVGKAIEERLLPFETHVTRVARNERTDERGTIHGMAQLPELLPLQDIVIVGVPLTPGTRHLIDDDFLSAMADGSVLVNIARGPVADTEALVRHTSTGRLRAALDVTDPEPLPSEHPLWRTPGVIVTPHVGGASSAMLPRMARLLERQISLLLSGQAPVNVVLSV